MKASDQETDKGPQYISIQKHVPFLHLKVQVEPPSIYSPVAYRKAEQKELNWQIKHRGNPQLQYGLSRIIEQNIIVDRKSFIIY